MENQPVFARILLPEQAHRVGSEISLRSVRFVVKFNNFFMMSSMTDETTSMMTGESC
jgi:hypothetical protein